MFLGAFGIIVREGLEAILVIAGMIAYLVKSGNQKTLKNVYIGSFLGVVMSFAAAWLLAWLKRVWTGAGQSQEVIEGITALIAVCVLFYVSNWMISKAEAASWSRYIDGKVQSSVETGSSFALAFTAFLSVFREGAEVVLFYQPMLNEGNPGMVWAGFGVGCVLLVFVYLAITKLSIRLPIRTSCPFGRKICHPMRASSRTRCPSRRGQCLRSDPERSGNSGKRRDPDLRYLSVA